MLRPGRLTRRYIDGERAKFISPMALYLLSVFLMYAVFSFTGGGAERRSERDSFWGSQFRGEFQVDNRAEVEATRQRISELESQLEAPELSPERRIELKARIGASAPDTSCRCCWSCLRCTCTSNCATRITCPGLARSSDCSFCSLPR